MAKKGRQPSQASRTTPKQSTAETATVADTSTITTAATTSGGRKGSRGRNRRKSEQPKTPNPETDVTAIESLDVESSTVKNYDLKKTRYATQVYHDKFYIPPKEKKQTGASGDAREWWEVPTIIYAFSHPKVRSRLEKLMGSNLVRLTDRKYMQKLHSRILLDYVQSMNKRIAQREEMEREREKILVLTGKIPMEDAPPEMSGHPVLLINAYCEKLIAERRAKIKVPKVVIPLWLYVDDTPDPPPALSIADGHHALRPEGGMLCIPPNLHLMTTDQEDIANGYMFTQDEFVKRFVYESPQIKELGQAQTVEEMYNLADEIIGTLKTLDTGK